MAPPNDNLTPNPSTDATNATTTPQFDHIASHQAHPDLDPTAQEKQNFQLPKRTGGPISDLVGGFLHGVTEPVLTGMNYLGSEAWAAAHGDWEGMKHPAPAATIGESNLDESRTMTQIGEALEVGAEWVGPEEAAKLIKYGTEAPRAFRTLELMYPKIVPFLADTLKATTIGAGIGAVHGAATGQGAEGAKKGAEMGATSAVLSHVAAPVLERFGGIEAVNKFMKAHPKTSAALMKLGVGSALGAAQAALPGGGEAPLGERLKSGAISGAASTVGGGEEKPAPKPEMVEVPAAALAHIPSHQEQPAHLTYHGPEFDTTVRAHLANDTVHAGSVGYHVHPDGTAEFYGAHVPENLRGQGIGQQLYRGAIDRALANPDVERVTSDSTALSQSADRVWQAMQRKGTFPITEITHPNGTKGYQILKNDVAEKTELSAQSRIEPDPELFNKAAAHFGLTDDFNKAGYIGQDGRMLDFSGGQDVRTKDHGDITEVEGVNIQPRIAREDFLAKTGAVRVLNGKNFTDVHFDLYHPPSQEQLEKVMAEVAKGNSQGRAKEVSVDVSTTDPVRFKTGARIGGAAGPVENIDQLNRLVRDARVDTVRRIRKADPTAEIYAQRPQLEPPARYQDQGQTALSRDGHEAAHIYVGEEVGLPGLEIRNHLHPTNLEDGASASAHLDYSKVPGAIYDSPTGKWLVPTSSVTKKLVSDQLGPMLMAGGVYEEMAHGTPFETNPVLSGDKTVFDQLLTNHLGLDDEEADLIRQAAIQKAREHLSKPGVLEKIHKHIAERAEGLPDSIIMDYKGVRNMIADIHGEKLPYDDNTKVTFKRGQRPPGLTRGQRNYFGAGNRRVGRQDVAPREGGAQGGLDFGRQEDTGKVSELSAQMRSDAAEHILDLHTRNGGSTFNLQRGDISAAPEYAVAIHPDREVILHHTPTVNDIQKFIDNNSDLLKEPQHNIGTWFDTSSGDHYLDVSTTTPDLKEAEALGRAHKQLAIYDLKNSQSISLSPETQADLSAKSKISYADFMKAFAPKPTAEPKPAAEPREMQENPEPNMTISTRTPNAKKDDMGEALTNHELKTDIEAAKNTPLMEKYANLAKKIPGFKTVKNETPAATVKRFVKHVADNIVYVYNHATAAEREEDAKWYPVGAKKISLDIAKDSGLSPAQGAAILAAPSPQTEWNTNVAMSKRIAQHLTEQKDTTTTPEMLDKLKDIAVGDKKWMRKLGPLMQGKTLGELSGDEQSLWIRLFDETHNTVEHNGETIPRPYEIWNPDGTVQKMATKADGEPMKLAWGNLKNIGKAVSVYHDGSRANISRNMGFAHKVRNFYNNIVEPDSPRNDVTSDTHNVRLGIMGLDEQAVLKNFGGVSHTGSGFHGTYPLYAEGIREAAKRLDINPPNRLQSITWSAWRRQFTDDFVGATDADKNRVNEIAINKIWKEHTDGKITAKQARDRIWQLASDWNAAAAARRSAESTRKNRGASNQGKLFEPGVSREPAREADTRRGNGTTSGNTPTLRGASRALGE